jgi:O-antigen ligase
VKFNVLLLLYAAALLTSIAAMELFAWVLFLVVAVTLIVKREKPKRLGPDLWLVGFALIAALGIFISGMPAKEMSMELALHRSNILEKPDRLVWLWGGLIAAASAYAFFQFVTGIDFIRPNHAIPAAGVHGFRARGFFSQSLTLAYVLGISMSMILPHIRRVKEKHILGILLVFGALGLFASLSRAPWFCIAIVAFIFGYQEFGKRALWGLIPAVGAFLGLFFFEQEFHKRIMDLFDFSTSASNGMRLDLWRGYWQVFLDHPVVGAGLFWGDEHLPSVFERLGINQPFVSHAHNNYIQALAGTGILGFICFVGFQFYFFKTARSLYHQLAGTSMGRLAQGVFLAQIFWQLGGLTECNFFDGEVNHSIVFGWAILIAIKWRSAPRTDA